VLAQQAKLEHQNERKEVRHHNKSEQFMKRKTIWVRLLLLVLLAGTGWTMPPKDTAASQVFTGEVMDTICARYKGHQHMMEELKSMGDTKQSCIKHCIEQLGASYVLYDPEKQVAYEIANQDKIAPYAGKRVRVSGTLQKKKINVTSIQTAG
jgi:hypothetical protein